MTEAQTISTPAGNGLARKPARRTREVAAICSLLALLVFAVFGQTMRHEFFNYDDDRYVYRNPEVIKGLTVGGLVQAFTGREMGLWNPLITIFHMVDCQLYGLNPGGHHLTNVLLHLASVILLFLILRQMTQTLWRSAFVAALFAIHPLRVESVAWIAERKDVLSGLFFMLTLGAYLHYLHRTCSVVRYLAVIFLFALGLMSKLMVVTLPLVLLLLDYWPLNRLFQPAADRSGSAAGISLNWRAVAEKIPLLALSCGLCVATMLGPKETEPIDPAPFVARIAEAPVSFVIYLIKMVWPTGLAVIYPNPEAILPWWPAALALWGLFSLGFFLLRRKHPYLWIGWLWNLGMLVPVSGIVQISRHGRADHYNYLPQIGLYIGLTWMVADWAGEWRHRRVALGSVAAVILCVLSMAAYHQTSYWRDSITLWTHTLRYTPDSSVAHNDLGEALEQSGRVDEAVSHFHRAVEINPKYADAQYNLGVALEKNGRTEEAIAQFNKALEIVPNSAKAHYNLGVTLEKAGRVDEAISHYNRALEINPNSVKAHYNLGIVLGKVGRADEAIPHFAKALELNPSSADINCNLGVALQACGRVDAAISHYSRALEINPKSVSVLRNLSWVLATCPEASLRNGLRAVALAEQANLLTGGSSPTILATLAAAYAETGRFDKALETAQAALQVTETQSNTDLASMLRREIKLYEAGQPFRDDQ